MIYLKSFIAGLTLPAIILSIIMPLALWLGEKEIVDIPFIHFIPLIWGIANVLVVLLLKKMRFQNESLIYLISGALLGFLVAAYGVFALNLTSIIKISYWPLLLGPILYAILWFFIVKPLTYLLIKNY